MKIFSLILLFSGLLWEEENHIAGNEQNDLRIKKEEFDSVFASLRAVQVRIMLSEFVRTKFPELEAELKSGIELKLLKSGLSVKEPEHQSGSNALIFQIDSFELPDSGGVVYSVSVTLNQYVWDLSKSHVIPAIVWNSRSFGTMSVVGFEDAMMEKNTKLTDAFLLRLLKARQP
ncbi:hypothetical protein AAFN60_21355 [Roseibacillus persicicus]|uniref:hypothetical protein n=1 Tax=Roseibacillus persicicus TaxID=454148 RepID=UPI00398A7FB2